MLTLTVKGLNYFGLNVTNFELKEFLILFLFYLWFKTLSFLAK